MDNQNIDSLTNTLQNMDLSDSDNTITELIDELISRPQFAIKTDYSNTEFRVDSGHLFTTTTTNFAFQTLDHIVEFIRRYTSTDCRTITICNGWGEELENYSLTNDKDGWCDINHQLRTTFMHITPEQVLNIMSAGNYIYLCTNVQHIYITGGNKPMCHISEHTHSVCSDYTQEIFSCIKDMLEFYRYAGGAPRWIVG